VPDWLFGSAWAILIVATAVWAVRVRRRWAVNLMTVFGSIHFYTQYFERLGASPGTLVGAGIVALAIAVGLAQYNRRTPTTPFEMVPYAA